jgi:hypothetical protein
MVSLPETERCSGPALRPMTTVLVGAVVATPPADTVGVGLGMAVGAVAGRHAVNTSTDTSTASNSSFGVIE